MMHFTFMRQGVIQTARNAVSTVRGGTRMTLQCIQLPRSLRSDDRMRMQHTQPSSSGPLLSLNDAILADQFAVIATTTALNQPRGARSRPLMVFDLPGIQPYAKVWQWQQRIVKDKVAAERKIKREAAAAQADTSEQMSMSQTSIPSLSSSTTGTPASLLASGLSDVLLLVEHDPIYTLGRNASLEHLRFPSHVRVRVAERGDLSAAANDPHPMLTIDHQNADDGFSTRADFELLRVERGGEVTFHGPGQLVMYPLLALNPAPLRTQSHSTSTLDATNPSSPINPNTFVDSPSSLSPFRADLHWFLRSLESVVIRFLALYDIEGERLPGASGVWVRDSSSSSRSLDSLTTINTSSSSSSSTLVPSPLRKLAAVGLSCSSWVSMHGCALNIDNDLEPFDFIIPCGLSDASKYGGVTSLKRVMQQKWEKEGRIPIFIDHAIIRRQLLQCFRDEFHLPSPVAILSQPPTWDADGKE